MMKFWKTWVALLVFAGLGAYAYFVESKKPDKEADAKKKEKVFSFERAKVKELTLESAESGAIRLVKEGDAWKLTAPSAVAADGSAVDSLVSSLETLEIDEIAADTAPNLADFGLDSPKLSVGLLVEGASEPMKLQVGAKTPDSGAVYAKVPAQGRVFTIASWVESSLNKKPFDLRDRDVLHVKRDAVNGLDVEGPEGGFSLVKDAAGEWAFSKPLQTRAGRFSVDGLVGTLESLRMDSVASENASEKDLKGWGLDKPARRVVLTLAEGGPKTLEIGSATADKKYYAREAGSPLVALIPQALPDDLAKGMSEHRAKRLLDVATYDVEGFDFEEGDKKLVYARSTTKDKDGVEQQKWKRTAPDAKDLETSKVQDALFKIGGIDVVEFVDKPNAPDAYGLDKPVAKLTLRMAGGKPPNWFELGQKDGATYARRPDDGSVLKLDHAKAEELLKAFREL